MTAASVHIGSTYTARVSGKLVAVRIERESPYGGWVACNTATGREVRIRTGRRLRPIASTARRLEFTLDGQPITRAEAQAHVAAVLGCLVQYCDDGVWRDPWRAVLRAAIRPDGCPLEGVGLLRARVVEP